MTRRALECLPPDDGTDTLQRLTRAGAKFSGSFRGPRSNMTRLLVGVCSMRNPYIVAIRFSVPGSTGSKNADAGILSASDDISNTVTSTVALEAGIPRSVYEGMTGGFVSAYSPLRWSF